MNFLLSTLIAADPEEVFAALTNIEKSPEVLPDVTRVEILSEARSGAGVRWKETRVMMGREATVELEIVDAVKPQSVTIRSESMNTAYTSKLVLTKASGGTHLAHEFTGEPGGFMARIMDKMMTATMKKAMQADLDAIKAYCESQGAPA